MKGINSGKKNGMYRPIGSLYISHGYIMVKVAEHKYKPLHRILIEKYIGRRLRHSEHVHHIDGDPLNNKLSNFFVFKNSGHHLNFECLIKNNYIKRNFIVSNVDILKGEVEWKKK
jgi:hypothetical protein